MHKSGVPHPAVTKKAIIRQLARDKSKCNILRKCTQTIFIN